MCGFVISLALYITINYLFYGVHKEVNQIDQIQLNFYVDNRCSNEVVNYSFEEVLKGISKLSRCAAWGLFFTVSLMIADILSVVIGFGCLRHIFKKK